MSLKIFFLMGACLAGGAAIAQNNDPEERATADRQGVVISTDELDYPDQSAILHVKNQAGQLAGLKFPEFQSPSPLTDMDQDGDIDAADFAARMNAVISNPQNGLLFYNPKGDLQGFYYYDESVTSRWTRLSSGNDKNIGIPDGTIIQYAGDLNLFTDQGVGKRGTKAEGWYICNGKNNTPDLTAAFIKGFNGDLAGDNNNVGVDNRRSGDYLVLKPEYLPQHTHDIKNFELEGGHDHKVMISPHKQDHYVYVRDSKKIAATDHNKGNHTIAYRYAYEKNASENELEPSTLNLQNPDRSGPPRDMKASLVTSEDVQAGRWLDIEGGRVTRAIDMRPAFFALVYIMKIEKPSQANNYTIKR